MTCFPPADTTTPTCCKGAGVELHATNFLIKFQRFQVCPPLDPFCLDRFDTRVTQSDIDEALRLMRQSKVSLNK